MPIKGGYLLAAGGGVILLWSGIRGKSWSTALRDVISGKNPLKAPNVNPITTSAAAYTTASNAGVAASGAISATGQAIESDALQYEGAPYVWAGVPGPHGVGPWDCSSFTNAVVGRDLRLAIPLYKAGSYNGQSHGPATGIWLVWSGAFTIKRADAAPGDLAIWQTHMGICISNDQMISAYDTQRGTIITSINGGGPFGEKLFIRRLKAVTVRG